MKDVSDSHIKPMLRQLVSYIEEQPNNRRLIESPTGFLDIDHCLRGFRNGELMVIASRPCMDKSVLMMNLVTRSLFQRKKPRPVLLVTGLTSALQYTINIVSSVTLLPLSFIARGELKDDDWHQLNLGFQKLLDLPLYVNDSARTLSDLEMAIQWCTDHHGRTPIVAIEDISILHLSDAGSFERQHCEVIKRLKTLAEQSQLPIVFTANVMPLAEDRPDGRPQWRDVEHIQHYEPWVDKILLLYREELYELETARKCRAEIIIEKNSMGVQTTVLMSFKPDYALFEGHHNE